MTQPIQTIEFKNDLGHVIQPGDTVVAITSGYNHSVNIQIGTFVGVRMVEYGDKSRVDSVVVDVPAKKRFVYDYETKKGEYQEPIKPTRRSTMPGKRIYPSTVPLSEFAGKRM